MQERMVRMLEDMPDRLPEHIPIECRDICEKQCQKICQIDCQNKHTRFDRIAKYMPCRMQERMPNSCQNECQNLCQMDWHARNIARTHSETMPDKMQGFMPDCIFHLPDRMLECMPDREPVCMQDRHFLGDVETIRMSAICNGRIARSMLSRVGIRGLQSCPLESRSQVPSE